MISNNHSSSEVQQRQIWESITSFLHNHSIYCVYKEISAFDHLLVLIVSIVLTMETSEERNSRLHPYGIHRWYWYRIIVKFHQGFPIERRRHAYSIVQCQTETIWCIPEAWTLFKEEEDGAVEKDETRPSSRNCTTMKWEKSSSSFVLMFEQGCFSSESRHV